MSNFLKDLQNNITISEGIEGHRAILREIYRAGHISLKDLSFQTLISIPVLSKIVHFLIENGILGRVPEGIIYSEKGIKFIEKKLNFYGFGMIECPECFGHPIYLSPRWDNTLDKLEIIFAKRPTVDTTIDHAFADPATSLSRALYLYNSGGLEGKSICFLGDDDYTSVAVANLYTGFYPNEPKLPCNEIFVFDIDERILKGINLELEKENLNINFKKWDYRKKVPEQYLNKFDTIMVDPPYSEFGLKLAISRSISLLRKNAGGEIYLSYAHKPAEQTLNLQLIILKMGLAIKEIIPRFNYYEGASILGNTTQIIKLETTSKSKPSIEASEEFRGKMYTGELNPKVRYYRCSNCENYIEVGSKTMFETIEELKEGNCPFCKSKGPFILE